MAEHSLWSHLTVFTRFLVGGQVNIILYRNLLFPLISSFEGEDNETVPIDVVDDSLYNGKDLIDPETVEYQGPVMQIWAKKKVCNRALLHANAIVGEHFGIHDEENVLQ